MASAAVVMAAEATVAVAEATVAVAAVNAAGVITGAEAAAAATDGKVMRLTSNWRGGAEQLGPRRQPHEHPIRWNEERERWVCSDGCGFEREATETEVVRRPSRGGTGRQRG